MEVTDKNGNVYGSKLEVYGPDGKPKTTGGGGGAPSGPAGGDLSGTYPDPTVVWTNGLPTYDLYYYSLANPSGYISGITAADVTTALGYTPYNSTNPANYITSASLAPYLTSAIAASTYQPILVSGINIKTVNSISLLGSGNITVGSNPRTLTSMNGLNLTGLTNQISASYMIPAGTLVTNNTIDIRSLLTKSAGSTTSTARMYINTSNSLTGATLIGTAGAMNAATWIQKFWRSFFFDGTNLCVYNPANGISSDITSGTLTLVPFNPAINYYLLFAIQNGTTTPDNLGHKRVIIMLYD